MRIINKILKYCLAAIIPLLLPFKSVPSTGDGTKDSIWRDMEYVRRTDAWNTSRNMAGLKFLPLNKLSAARLSAEKSDGPFINYNQSDDSYTPGAMTESFYRLNPRVVVSGKVSYYYFQGKNMGGSAFIDPQESPIDITDYATNTRGTKKEEEYFLSGSISSELTSRLTLGGGIDYTAANFTKTKDLRHTNTLLDMTAKAGAIYRLNPAVYAGLSYDYRRRVEALSFGAYGNKGQQYSTLISFGAFFGLKELHSEEATYTGEKKPLVSNTHSLSLQLGLQVTPRLQFFNELSAGFRNGYFGTRGTAKVVHTEDETKQYTYRGVLTWKNRQSLHSLTLKAAYQTMLNMENVPRSETLPGSNEKIVYYGKNEVLDKQTLAATLGYTADLGLSPLAPAWRFGIQADFYNREQTASQYPFYRKQSISSYQAGILAGRNIIRRKNIYGITLQTTFGSGGGTPKNDGVYASPSASATAPETVEEYLYTEYEYLTASRVKAGAEFRYSRPMDKGVIPYLQTGYHYIKAFNVTYTGGYSHMLNLTVGCTF